MSDTTEQDEVDQCKDCKWIFPKSELRYGPDPFAEEIHGDTTPTVLCEGCYRSSCWEI